MISLALVLFLMTLTAFMYIDILGAKAEVKEQLIKLERLRKEIENQAKEQ
jgi:HAMP domain-containing protein